MTLLVDMVVVRRERREGDRKVGCHTTSNKHRAVVIVSPKSLG